MKKAIILTAGLGTRLRPITYDVHKALIPVANTPLLLKNLRNLKAYGFDHFFLNKHYKTDQIDEFCCKYKKDFDLHTVYEPEISGTGGALFNFEEEFSRSEDFLLHNCDIVYELELEKLIEFHRCHNPIATLGLIDFPDKNSVLVNENGSIRGFDKDYEENELRKLTFTGISIINADIYQYLANFEGKFSLVKIFEKIIEQQAHGISGYQFNDGYWRDIGTPKSLWTLHKELIGGASGASMNGVYLGANVALGDDVKLTGFVCIGDNVTVGEGTYLKDSIVFPETRVKSNRSYHRTILWDDNELKID